MADYSGPLNLPAERWQDQPKGPAFMVLPDSAPLKQTKTDQEAELERKLAELQKANLELQRENFKLLHRDDCDCEGPWCQYSGDLTFVKITARVVEHIPGVGYHVELFSKTDEYTAWVREDLVEEL